MKRIFEKNHPTGGYRLCILEGDELVSIDNGAPEPIREAYDRYRSLYEHGGSQKAFNICYTLEDFINAD